MSDGNFSTHIFDFMGIRSKIMGILVAAAHDNGFAVVVVTHDPNVAAFCGRTVTMRDGWLGGAR